MNNKLIIEPNISRRGKITRITADGIFTYCPEPPFDVKFYTNLVINYDPNDYDYYFYEYDKLYLDALYRAYPGCPVKFIKADSDIAAIFEVNLLKILGYNKKSEGADTDENT